MRVLLVDDSGKEICHRLSARLRHSFAANGVEAHVDHLPGYGEALVALKAARAKGKPYDAIFCDSELDNYLENRMPILAYDMGVGAVELAMSLRSGNVIEKVNGRNQSSLTMQRDQHAEEQGLGYQDKDVVFVYCGGKEDFPRVQKWHSINEAIDCFVPHEQLDGEAPSAELNAATAKIVETIHARQSAIGA